MKGHSQRRDESHATWSPEYDGECEPPWPYRADAAWKRTRNARCPKCGLPFSHIRLHTASTRIKAFICSACQSIRPVHVRMTAGVAKRLDALAEARADLEREESLLRVAGDPSGRKVPAAVLRKARNRRAALGRLLGFVLVRNPSNGAWAVAPSGETPALRNARPASGVEVEMWKCLMRNNSVLEID